MLVLPQELSYVHCLDHASVHGPGVTQFPAIAWLLLPLGNISYTGQHPRHLAQSSRTLPKSPFKV